MFIKRKPPLSNRSSRVRRNKVLNEEKYAQRNEARSMWCRIGYKEIHVKNDWNENEGRQVTDEESKS